MRPALPPSVPIVRRGGGLQVGLRPAVLLADPPPGAQAALARLDGARPTADVAAETGVSVAWLQMAENELAGAGLLTRPLPRRVAVVGSGRLARVAVRAAVARGWQTVSVADPLGGAFPSPIPGSVVAASWAGCDGVVVALDRGSPDRVLATELLRADVEHVYCHGGQDGASVGPLVLPGRSACLRCLDLSLAARDPEWPLVAAQLERQAFDVDEAAAAWAAGLAVAQLGAERGACVDGTVELHGATIQHRTWRRHPACGCAEPLAWAG